VPEKVIEYFKQWLSPGIVLGIIGWVFLLGVGSNRLEGLEKQVAELQVAISASTVSNQNATVELVRYQERIASLTARLAQIEDFKTTQEQINVRVFSGLAKLGG
jgi:hypothetical protein